MFIATAAAGAITLRADFSDAVRNLKPMTGGVQAITDDERRARIAKAQRLMAENKIGAIVLESGSSMYYFTGTRGVATDRLFGLILPAKGEGVFIVPENAHSSIVADIRVAKSDAEAYKIAAQFFKERSIDRIGIEERTRFAVFDGLRGQAPHADFVSADAVTAGCRMIKSPAEIALMQRATDITIVAYKAALGNLKEGMTQHDLSANIAAAYQALGVRGDAMASFGKYTAFPHGSIQPQHLREGDMILVDDGCSVEGYQSDVTRAVVFGTPSARQREIWSLEKKAQSAAFAAAKVGAMCESVDAAARKVITDAGMGPDYKVPGLPHRTGHGIGLDIHEWTYFVRGNKTRIQPGMCFSDEPMITNYTEFGVRLEDCLYITADGPKFFSQPSPAIEQPFA
jgi:Xaa-Pro dipeptidase